MPNIMTQDAVAIANKLNHCAPEQPGRLQFRIETKEGQRHTIVKVWYGDQCIGQYGIQRASNEKRHNYVAGQLYLSRNDAYRLAKCPLDVDGYIDILRDQGEIL
jgi:hypothetical protein